MGKKWGRQVSPAAEAPVGALSFRTCCRSDRAEQETHPSHGSAEPGARLAPRRREEQWLLSPARPG